jgi:hypothetical protein
MQTDYEMVVYTVFSKDGSMLSHPDGNSPYQGCCIRSLSDESHDILYQSLGG